MKKKAWSMRLAAIILLVIMGALLSEIGLAESYSAVVSKKQMKVYSGASLKEPVGTLPRWTVISVLDVDGDTARFLYNRKLEAYCNAEDVVNVEDIARPATVNSANAKAYLEADVDSETVSIAKGTKLNVLAESGKWALIEKNGVGAYMQVKFLTYDDMPTPAPIDEPEPEPSPDTPEEIDAVVTANKLTVYKKASETSDVMGTLKYGTEVTVLAYNKKWAYIKLNDKTGYCRVSGLTKKDEFETPAPEITPTPVPDEDDYIPAVVAAKSVKVYKRADVTSKLIATLKMGDKVNVVVYNNTWAQIEKDGKFGFCKVKALTKDEPQPSIEPEPTDDDYRNKYPDKQFTATVVYDFAPVYAALNTDTVKEKLPIMEQVDVYAYNKNWAYIGIGNGRGFMQVKYLSKADYKEMESGDSGAEVQQLQEELEKLGYFDGLPGGSFNTLTSTAVKRFQSAISASQTGKADVPMLRVLYGGYAPESPMLSTSLEKGATGTSVERLQTRFYYLGYLSKTSSIDGDFGSNTAAAVKLFQKQAQLTQDGVADAAVMRALYSGDAPKLPSSIDPADYTAPDNGGGNKPGTIKMPAGLESIQSSLPDNPSKSEKIEYVIYNAQNQLGKPYIYGTAGPNSFDCSGLTCFAFKKIGITLGRSAYAQGYQSNTGTKIETMDELERGDIVCFNTISDSDLSDHVGIYIGKGYFIHASSGSGNGRQVCVSNLKTGYYTRVFSWGRRPLK